MSVAKRIMFEEMERTCSECGADITPNQWNLCTECYAGQYFCGPERSIVNRLFDIREELEEIGLTDGDSLYQLVNASISVAIIKQQKGEIPGQPCKASVDEEIPY